MSKTIENLHVLSLLILKDVSLTCLISNTDTLTIHLTSLDVSSVVPHLIICLECVQEHTNLVATLHNDNRYFTAGEASQW